ncbi:MAG: hypothetical protein VKP62_11935 [Candidatus Sericytochromatia bacterium]|nr:hypothetical protein [Candidatus Sericytochromatia bacterium]
MPSPDETLEAIAAALAAPWTPETLEAINQAMQALGRGVPSPWGAAEPLSPDATAPAGSWLSAEQALSAWRDPERLGYDAVSALYNAREGLVSAREALCEGAVDHAAAITQLEWVADRLSWAGTCAAAAAEAALKGDRR